jgi:hypothetical protein
MRRGKDGAYIFTQLLTFGAPQANIRNTFRAAKELLVRLFNEPTVIACCFLNRKATVLKENIALVLIHFGYISHQKESTIITQDAPNLCNQRKSKRSTFRMTFLKPWIGEKVRHCSETS